MISISVLSTALSTTHLSYVLDPKEAVRAAAHGDINLITLLMGAHGKGLQVKHSNGDWIDAMAEKDELMIFKKKSS